MPIAVDQNDVKFLEFLSARYGKSDFTIFNLADAMDWRPLIKTDLTTGDNDKNFTVPALRQWRIQAIRVELNSTSSTAVAGSTAPRQLEVQIRSTSDDVTFSMVAGLTQSRDLLRIYNLAENLADLTSFVDTNKLTTPFPSIMLEAGHDIRIFDNANRNPSGDNMVVHVHVLERLKPTTA